MYHVEFKKIMSNILKDQEHFIHNSMNMVASVLNRCNEKQLDCICVSRVRYLKDNKDLPEHKKYMTEVFCDEAGSEFHKYISEHMNNKKKSYN